MGILDALRRERNEISELLPLLLGQEQLPGLPPVAEDNDASAVRAILGEPEATRPVLSGPKPPVAKVAPPSAIRQLSIQLSANAPLLPFDDTNLSAAEQYRIIRTRLIQHAMQPRMILISSAGPGDGKSVTAVNVAGVLSLKSEGSVVLVDADFRRSTIHTQMGLPVAPGMTEVLRGAASLEEALIRTRQFPNLYVIPAGTPVPNPSDLLDAPNWRAICEDLRSRFRYVIVDSPPVASVADYDLLLASCDGVVLTMRPDHSRRATCLKAIEVTPQEKLIGVIINCVPKWFLHRGDQYYGYSNYGLGDRREGA